ncbi:hypothetical protein D4Q52_24975 [Rhodopseudomonas palustris]|uniref:Uncharacterized protein n=1 Tax=Rhodopseudomonas palustris TaxID=1076 RepID=A0A418UX68_RHOPL|nr:hypothetical protein D4Q52_24975 [Rhodopseudomonas palustris]
MIDRSLARMIDESLRESRQCPCPAAGDVLEVRVDQAHLLLASAALTASPHPLQLQDFCL